MLASKEMVLLKEDDKRIAALSQKNGIKERSLLGSVLHDAFYPASDNLVKFKPGPKTSSLAPERMENNFFRLIERRICRVTNRGLGHPIREGVLRVNPFRT
ncbi:MAG TPA: hypothetical protein VMW83_03180 [Spirochaetia bacterium]|nr:hypothetical protein [Spirochaetia bacterium]